MINEKFLDEASLIGCVLMDSSCIKEVANKLQPMHFSNAYFREIYRAMLQLHSQFKQIDLVNIHETVDDTTKQSLLDITKACASVTTTTVYIKDYAEAILRKYKVRMYREIMNDYNRNATTENVQDEIAKTINKLEDLSKNDNKERLTSIQDIIDRNCYKYFNKDYKIEKTFTGFYGLDEKIDGLQRGDVIVIGARPAVGKSAFVNQVAINVSKKKKVAYYSLEMTEQQVFERMLAYTSTIELGRLKNAKEFIREKNEVENFTRGIEDLKRLKLHISNIPGAKVSDIENDCRYMDDLGLIIIDYLQLMKCESTYRGNRTAEVGEISKSLKEMALRLNVPIIVLSQLNRSLNMRENKEPNMADLRESGDIEQDASVIILIWNLDEDNDKSAKGLKIDKNRHGECGKFVYRFDGGKMKFKETSERIEDFSKTRVTAKAISSSDPF